MANWSTSPPDGTPTNAFRLLRTPETGRLAGILTCEELLGTCIHFYHGRSMPHRVEDCPACLENRPYRWMAYLSAIIEPSGEHAVVEVTARVHAAFENVCRKMEAVRGIRFCLLRPNGKKNGRVHGTFSRDVDRDTKLPPSPDVKTIMEAIWRGNLDRAHPELTDSRPNGQPRMHDLTER